MALQGYQQTTANWRSVIAENTRRSYLVIFIFIVLYAALGFLIDLFINANHYPQAPLQQIALALLSGHLIPKITFITIGIAVISLWVAFSFHDKLMLLGTEYREISLETAKTASETQLYHIIEEMKVAAGLRYMPKVFIIQADYMNAFASGYSEKSAMVAITQGLLNKLDRAELTAVMAHELSHIRHMDIKLTLMASVLANLMLIMIDLVFYGVLFGSDRRDREGGGNWLVIAIVILRYVLPLVTVLLMLFLSRRREYMADAGCVELMRDNEPLARALLKISSDHEENLATYQAAYAQTPHDQVRREAYIFDPIMAGIEAKSAASDFFSTHPSIAKRLEALGFKKN